MKIIIKRGAFIANYPVKGRWLFRNHGNNKAWFVGYSSKNLPLIKAKPEGKPNSKEPCNCGFWPCRHYPSKPDEILKGVEGKPNE